jgi:hypothetical protein
MSFCSGFATVCLVAELTGLIDIIRTSLKEAAARFKNVSVKSL